MDRVHEIARLRWLWRPGAVITIVGPPGSGKTRLATELTRRPPERDASVSWPPVGGRGQLEAICSAVLADVGGPGSIVVLDDADHALDACADIAMRLVRARPQVTVLATSRQVLGISQERLVRIEGLAIPAAADLFADRSRLLDPAFRLGPGNAAADVCRRLDGLPLAIELAAHHMRHMTVRDLLTLLDDPEVLARLVSIDRDVPSRHANLEAAVAWSFDRLTDEQRAAAIQLSWLRLGAPFRLRDAIDVATSERLPADRVVEVMSQLIDRSLLLHATDPKLGVAYRMPAPVQRYGRSLANRLGWSWARRRGAWITLDRASR
jgi:predicted ATPase